MINKGFIRAPYPTLTGVQEESGSKTLPDLILEVDKNGAIIEKIAPVEIPHPLLPCNNYSGLNLQSLLPEQAGLFDSCLQKISLTKEVQHFEYKVPEAGKIRFFEIRLAFNTKDRFITIISEITEKKLAELRAEEVLFTEKENLAVTLRSIADGIIAADINGKIVLMNKAAEDITGWSQNEAIGEQLSKVYRTYNNQQNQMANGFDFWEHTFLFTKDGQERVITDNGAAIHNLNGDITGVVVVFRDITEKWRMEEEIQRTQRLESVGSLAGGIAHDFNNILSVILANIQLVKISLEKGRDVNKYLDGIENAVSRSADLTKQLLTFSKGGAPVKKTALLSDLLRETIELSIKGSGIKCTFLFQENLWLAEIDPSQINQVFSNLATYAIQTASNGGAFEIIAENKTITSKDVLPLLPGKYIRITFKDNGPGLTKEKLQKLFDPYYLNIQEVGDFGLAVSYSIIRRHNGMIGVQSEPGSGTVFTIYLPAASKNAPTPEPIKTLPQKGKKILLMDDEKKITELIGEMLHQNDFIVETAVDGVEALELFKKAEQLKEPFDVVIMDLTIPGGMGGREAISFLRKLNPDVKAIVSSGYSNDPVMANYKDYGFNGVVSKPYKIEELCEEIYRVLNAS